MQQYCNPNSQDHIKNRCTLGGKEKKSTKIADFQSKQ